MAPTATVEIQPACIMAYRYLSSDVARPELAAKPRVEEAQHYAGGPTSLMSMTSATKGKSSPDDTPVLVLTLRGDETKGDKETEYEIALTAGKWREIASCCRAGDVDGAETLLKQALEPFGAKASLPAMADVCARIAQALRSDKAITRGQCVVLDADTSMALVSGTYSRATEITYGLRAAECALWRALQPSKPKTAPVQGSPKARPGQHVPKAPASGGVPVFGLARMGFRGQTAVAQATKPKTLVLTNAKIHTAGFLPILNGIVSFVRTACGMSANGGQNGKEALARSDQGLIGEVRDMQRARLAIVRDTGRLPTTAQELEGDMQKVADAFVALTPAIASQDTAALERSSARVFELLGNVLDKIHPKLRGALAGYCANGVNERPASVFGATLSFLSEQQLTQLEWALVYASSFEIGTLAPNVGQFPCPVSQTATGEGEMLMANISFTATAITEVNKERATRNRS